MINRYNPSKEKKQAKKIYLAGKIGGNDWRYSIVDGLHQSVNPFSPEWPILPKAIFGRFDYVGPYFVSGCHDHACFREDHGYGDNGSCLGDYTVLSPAGRVDEDMFHNIPEAQLTARSEIIKACLERIESADLVFAWIDSPDAYGTIFELAYAYGLRQKGWRGFICATIPCNCERNCGHYCRTDFNLSEYKDMWFTLQAIPTYRVLNPQNFLSKLFNDLGWMHDFESPLEEAFWQAWIVKGCTSKELTPQYKIGRYRLDFAHIPTKTAIELDGFTYHNDEKSFLSDRQRDRELSAAGWQVIRFGSKELQENIGKCVEQAYKIITSKL